MAKKALSSGTDWLTLTVYLSLVVIGYIMVYAAFYEPGKELAFLDINTEIGRQGAWLIIALVTFAIIMAIDWTFWNTFAFVIYGVGMVMLFLVIFIGREINGAKAWIFIGPLSFQPAELMKLGTCLAVASYLSFNKNDIRQRKTFLTILAIIFAPVLLILLQPDPGSALVFFSFFMLLYRKGLDNIYYIIAFSMIAIFILTFLIGPYLVTCFALAIACAIIVLNLIGGMQGIGISLGLFVAMYLTDLGNFEWGMLILPVVGLIIAIFLSYKKKTTDLLNVLLPLIGACIILSFSTNFAFENFLKPHQQDRINAWLRPELCDPRGSLYNIINSKMAIASGGFEGKGFLKGEMTKLNYVPEQPTDFIFTTVGEEQGFIGSFSVIILFTILIIQCIRIAERARLEFFRNYAYGVAGILFIHFIINIGMTIGLMPVIGIPLPFISKGGTSLVIFSTLVAIMIKMDASKNRA